MNSWKVLKRNIHYAVVRLALGVVGVLPRRVSIALFAALGHLAYAMFPRERRRVLDNLERAFGQLSEPQRRHLARDVFADLGRNGADVVRALSGDPRRYLGLVDVEGLEHLERARRGGRGAVCVTGHIGAWDLLGGWLALQGETLYVVARPLKDARYQRLIDRLRERLNVRVIHEGQSIRPMVRALRSGALLGLLIDQNRVADGVWVPFFGRPAYTASGIVDLARLGRAPIVPMVIQRVGSRHLIRMHPAIEVDGDGPEATRKALTECSAALESWIRQHPSQWAWMYDRWGSPRRATPVELQVESASRVEAR
jgi:KDO2-lipid IV(A) lauroyltransferase